MTVNALSFAAVSGDGTFQGNVTPTKARDDYKKFTQPKECAW